MTITVLLADDHNIVREGLMSLLEKEPDVEVVAMADNGRTAVQLAAELKPDVAVLDLAMPEMNGIEAARRISHDLPQVRILVLSMHSARRFVAEALSAGATGYLLKDCAADDLVRAIRTVAAGETFLSSKVAGQIVRDYLKRSSDPVSPDEPRLTNREREVLQLIAEGECTKEIAFKLGVSIKTVETHRQQIMKKLNLHGVADLTRYAIREGLTPLN